MNTYLWILLGSLFVQSSWCVRVDRDSEKSDEAASQSSRQPRQNAAYRGNTRFQVPSYLNPDHYAREIYSTDRRGAPDGSFAYEFQTENGIKRKEESFGYGANKVVRGFYSYIGADGKTYTTRYIADRFGYRAYGAHLPTQPDELYDQTRLPLLPPQQFQPEYNQPAYYPPRPIPPQPEHHQPSFYPRPHPQPAQPAYQHQHHNQQYQPSIDRFDNIPSQHQLQTTTFQTRPIYVQEPPSTPNYLSITPRPIASASPINSGLLPPAAYLSSNNHYANQPFSWTTAKPHYNSASQIRPYI